MKFVEPHPFTNPDAAARKLVEIANGVEEARAPEPALRGKTLFLTNAVRGIVPIASLDQAPVPTDSRTSELATRFWP